MCEVVTAVVVLLDMCMCVCSEGSGVGEGAWVIFVALPVAGVGEGCENVNYTEGDSLEVSVGGGIGVLVVGRSCYCPGEWMQGMGDINDTVWWRGGEGE